MFLSKVVCPGDRVIDATMGNGNDTLFLAQLVGPQGKVFSFDVQKQACERTARLLSQHGIQHVDCVQNSHVNMDHTVKDPVKAIVFNLGYLPGSDKSCCTLCSTTLTALKKSLELLLPGGLLLLAIYPGHAEGLREKEQLLSFAARLPQQQYNVFSTEFINHCHHPPLLLGIEKRS
ncbi:MAG: methyltransferase domain-containing protein [Candidatus Omnitrophica bacterium]|nr:methyltransferase domain-containing protein [Candidatus Omnitrophota bacterium]